MTDNDHYKDLNAEIGRWLAYHRKLRGLSQSEVAERLGVTKTAVHYWETGKRMIYAKTMMDYCHLLDIDPQDLVRDVTNTRKE